MVNEVEVKDATSQPSGELALKGPWKRLAQVISEVANPLFVALPTFLLIVLKTAPDIIHALLWWGIIVVGISAVPFLFILRGVRRGTYSDHHVSVREQRLVPLLIGIGCAIIVFLLLLFIQAASSLLATLVSVLVALGVSTVITQRWKISLHLVGIAGAVTALSLLFGPYFLLLSPLVIIVGWARWQVRAHTVLQAFAGTLLAIASTLGIFILWHVI